MTDYTITTNFGAKDSLPSGNAGKVIKGSEFTTEFTNIQTAVNTKADTAGDTFTGAVNFSADVAVNTNTLFVDVSEDKVGIGTTSPQAPLHVHGDINLGNSAGADAADVEIASLNFYNRDTSNSAPNNAAIIRAYSSQETGSGGYLTLATSNGTEAEGADATEKMRIDASGNVGIGTTSPSDKLHVSTGTDTDAGNIAFTIGGSSTSNGRTASITKNTSTPYELTIQAGNHATSNMETVFKSSDSKETMRIDSSGNVLVGRTSGSADDEDNGVVLSPTGFIYSARGGTGSANHIAFINNTDATAITVGTIRSSGSTTSYNTSSDERLKENITDSADAGSKVDAIQIRQFDWIADGSHQDYGVIAQELVEVAPEAVSEGDTEEDMMGVDYSKLVPMLIKEVQSLRSRVAELENV